MRTAFLVALLPLLAIAAPAGAQPLEGDPRIDQARAAFDEGTRRYGEGRYALAAEAFQRSNELLVAAGHENAGLVLFNLAQSLSRMPGRERDARDAYQRFLAGARANDPENAATLETAQTQLREVEARIAGLERGPRARRPGGLRRGLPDQPRHPRRRWRRGDRRRSMPVSRRTVWAVVSG